MSVVWNSTQKRWSRFRRDTRSEPLMRQLAAYKRTDMSNLWLTRKPK